MASAPTADKDAALGIAADLLESRAGGLLAANSDDLAEASGAGATQTHLDRLRLTDERVRSMATALRAVASLADPVGTVTDGYVRPNGLRVSRVRVPLGVVGIIYENRPNVTSDSAALCIKSGNAVMLRGSSSATRSNVAVAGCLRDALAKSGLPEDAVVLTEPGTHESAIAFMRLDGVLDCLIPRGGPSLLASVRANATVPVVVDGDGNCHVFVDRSADLDMAREIVVNAKTQRPGVCNAAETLLVHRDVAASFLPEVAAAMPSVQLLGDRTVQKILGCEPASDDDFATEFLGLQMSVAVVDDLEGAIEHIGRFGSGHSEAVVTTDLTVADAFVRRVDAAAVVVNASTRFVDGEELGLGAEIGISTQKLHARGPMGLEALTCVKWVIAGDGHVRGQAISGRSSDPPVTAS